jgi:D-tyrosyl-tRNA(Tyr) deacylase
MRAVIQRVHRAQVDVEGQCVGKIGRGLVVFLGVSRDDEQSDTLWLAEKISRIRCFEDAAGRMNASVLDIDGSIMVISQFTLFGNLRKGTRPSFNEAASPDKANALYLEFMEQMELRMGKPIPCGRFGAHMDIDMQHDGPVTLIIDSRKRDF